MKHSGEVGQPSRLSRGRRGYLRLLGHARRRLLIALLVALSATVVSGIVYPGGVSRREPARQGYSLTRNYFSDLGMTVTYGGQRNLLGSALFVITCLGYGYAAWAFAVLVAQHGVRGRADSGAGSGEAGLSGGAEERGRRRGLPLIYFILAPGTTWRRLVALGVFLGGGVAAAGFFLTGLTPKDLLFHLHNWVSYSAFLGLLLLWIAASIYLPPGVPRRASTVMVVVSAAYLAVLYSRPDWQLPAGWQVQVVAQKIIVLANWVGLLVAGLAFRSDVSRETNA